MHSPEAGVLVVLFAVPQEPEEHGTDPDQGHGDVKGPDKARVAQHGHPVLELRPLDPLPEAAAQKKERGRLFSGLARAITGSVVS